MLSERMKKIWNKFSKEEKKDINSRYKKDRQQHISNNEHGEKYLKEENNIKSK